MIPSEHIGDMDQGASASMPGSASSDTLPRTNEPRSDTPLPIAPWLAGILFLGAIFISYQLIGSVITVLLIGTSITPDNVNAMRIATVFAQVVFLAGPVFVFTRIFRWNVRAGLRLHPIAWRPALAVILAVVALQFVLQGYMTAQEHILRTYILTPSLEKLYDAIEKLIAGAYKSLLLMQSPWELGFVWTVVAFTPALCEELVFRGVVQRAFEKSMRARWAILLNAAIFAMFHLYPTQFVALTSVGLLLGYVVWRGNSLYYGMIAHATNNTISVLSVYFLGYEAASQEVAAAGAAQDTAYLAGAGLIVLFAALFAFRRFTMHRDTTSPPFTIA